ncbi:hypothetical protein CRENBAI_001129 [Crenichthys baileyi]|uniref:Uncharacterized protein n=1 Tax=Crenichthys baileyi TaxID=28760 RepID=A0AAV9SG11_9TELE
MDASEVIQINFEEFDLEIAYDTLTIGDGGEVGDPTTILQVHPHRIMAQQAARREQESLQIEEEESSSQRDGETNAWCGSWNSLEPLLSVYQEKLENIYFSA